MANLSTWADETAFCIIDSDGIDTRRFLRLRGQPSASISRLPQAARRPGTISNIGGQIGNMTLAVGTVIENAVGGSGNDTIIGNTGDNVLTGNAGNDVLQEATLNADTLNGGAGNDTLYAMTSGDIDGSGVGDILNGDAGDDTIREAAAATP